ncbi:hypothetical protein ABEY96_12870 [Priestia aryabhattai]
MKRKVIGRPRKAKSCAEIDSTSLLIQVVHLYIGLISLCPNLSTLYQY